MTNDPDLGQLDGHWNCRLTVKGRKSGEPRSVTIWYALGDGCIYLAGGPDASQWYRNLRANGDVIVQIGATRLRGRARAVDEPTEAAAIRERFVRRYLLARLSRAFGGYTRSVTAVIEELRPAT